VAADTAGGSGHTPSQDEGAAEVAEVARAGEPDRHLAALLAPAPEREALLALAAFAAELARIPHRAVREPFMGEIRLQWWRDALVRDPGESSGSSVADAVRIAVRHYDLPTPLLAGMIDARGLELLPAPFTDEGALQDHLWRTEGALFALACRVLGPGMRQAPGPDIEAASAAAGRAYGLARLVAGLPRSLSLGRVPLARTGIAAAGLTEAELLAAPDDARAAALLQAAHAQIRGNLAEARRLVRAVPRQARIAFLPLALVGPYLRLLERRGVGALRAEVQIVPLTRVWRIGAAHLLGRL
jgi:phytoene synthase